MREAGDEFSAAADAGDATLTPLGSLGSGSLRVEVLRAIDLCKPSSSLSGMA